MKSHTYSMWDKRAHGSVLDSDAQYTETKFSLAMQGRLRRGMVDVGSVHRDTLRRGRRIATSSHPSGNQGGERAHILTRVEEGGSQA